jgi:hypothetical protein
MCGLAVAVVRFLHFGRGYTNDHFVYITGGFQILAGEWPTRDWVDGGAPLTVVASALAQALIGPTVLAEAVLTALAFGVAAGVTYLLVARMTASHLLGLLAAGLELAAMPRTYSYPKVLVYAVTCLCIQAYASRPGLGRLAGLAVSIAVAFLFRHDHGAFLAVGAAVAVWLATEGPARARARVVLSLATLTVVLLLPYFAYVQVYEGLPRHFGIGAGLGEQEFAGRMGGWPRVIGDPTPFASALLYQYYALPVAALGVLLAGRRRPDASCHRALVAGMAVVGLLVNATFLRDPLSVRLPDPIVPALVLGAWLVYSGLAARRWLPTLLAALGAGLFSASVLEAGSTRDVINQTGLLDSWGRVPVLVEEARLRLAGRLPVRAWPSRAAERLQPFYGYLERCSTMDDRLIVGGFLVDVPFFARRLFAGGQRYFGGSYGFDPAAEARALERLSAQRATFALVPADTAAAFARAFPALAAHLNTHYAPMAEVSVASGQTVTVYVDTRRVAWGVDETTGWPCFVPARTARLQ